MMNLELSKEERDVVFCCLVERMITLENRMSDDSCRSMTQYERYKEEYEKIKIIGKKITDYELFGEGKKENDG